MIITGTEDWIVCSTAVSELREKQPEAVTAGKCVEVWTSQDQIHIKATLCNFVLFYHKIMNFKSFDAAFAYNRVNGVSVVLTLNLNTFFWKYVMLYGTKSHTTNYFNCFAETG